ncbi:MAG: hypothetical protein WDW36_004671 [Sanguina aurantia]
MPQRDHDIYASAPLRQLQDDQTRALTPDLQRCFGDYALLVDASPDNLPPPALPMLGCWIRLTVDDTRYRGDLHAETAEALPFIDDAFELVFLRHALEAIPLPSSLLAEAARVLAPGGVLAIGGVHPLSAWLPWFRWRARGQRRHLTLPVRLVLQLQQQGFDIERVQRVGSMLPGTTRPDGAGATPLGGGYILIARKRRRAVTPLRLQPAPLQVPASSRLSPSTRRSASA